MSEEMGGGHCVSFKQYGYVGIACGVKGELTHADQEEIAKFARFLKSKHEFEQQKKNEGVEP